MAGQATITQALITGFAGDIVTFQGYREAPPVIWSKAAEEGNNSSTDSIEGRYYQGHGSAGAAVIPKIVDTTFSSGLNTGTVFDIVSGGAYSTDAWKSRRTGAHGLFYSNAAAGGAFEWVEHTGNATIPVRELILRRGPCPIGVTPGPTTYSAYLHLNYQGVNGDYRIKFVAGMPIGLQYAPDGVTWTTVGDARDLGAMDHYFESHGDGIRILVKPFFEDNFILVEVGNGYQMVHAISTGNTDPVMGSTLPYGGKVRLIAVNGYGSLEVYPSRHGSVSLTVAPRNFGKIHPNMSRAFVVTGGRSKLPADQVNSFTLNTDGQNLGYTLTAMRPDAGDGLGSADSPRIAEATVVVPASWTTEGTYDVRPLNIELMEQYQTFDDQARVFSTRGVLTLNNQYGQYYGAVGRSHLVLYGSNDNGATTYPIFTGVLNAGGQPLEFTHRAGRSVARVSYEDIGIKMCEALGVEVITDGWATPSFARVMGELGNIHPQFMQSIPLYVPPGASSDAPYGPSGTDYSGYSLGRGTGLNAKFRWTPERSPHSCLQVMAQQFADPDPSSGRVIPYYMGVTQPDSQLHFESYDPFQVDAAAFLSDANTAGAIPLVNVFRVVSDVSQMRTDITFEGLEAFTNVLNYVHLENSDAVKRLVGWASTWVERNTEWGTLDYLTRTANLALAQSAIPDQILLLECGFYVPWLQASQVVLVNANNPAYSGTGPYVIIAKLDRAGIQDNGMPVNTTLLIVRSLYSYP